MIFALYGEDTYRSRKKLNEIIRQYKDKVGSTLNFYALDCEEENVREGLRPLLAGGSLFAEKKLAVIKHAFTGSAGEAIPLIQEEAPHIKDSRDIVLVLWDHDLDAPTKKAIKGLTPFFTKSQDFTALLGSERMSWIREEAESRGLRLRPDEAGVIASTEKDSWSIVHTLDKMALAPEGLRQSVRIRSGSATIFQLGDYMFTSRPQALHTLFTLLRQGEDAFPLFSYVAGHARTLLAVKLSQEGKKITGLGKMHPFVLKKAGSAVRAMNRDTLAEAVRGFFEEDVRIKQGFCTPTESLLSLMFRFSPSRR